MEQLIKFWRTYDPPKENYAHQDDWEYLNKLPTWPIERVHSSRETFGERIKSERLDPDSNLYADLSLRPRPYIGNLCAAQVIILLLNPDYGYHDHYAETSKKFIGALEENLSQNITNSDFPFIYLNPEFAWHGGFAWWETKLKGVVVQLQQGHQLNTYSNALSYLSQRIACIELMPYASRHFGWPKYLQNLPSVKNAKAAVADLLRQPRDKRPAIVVARGATKGKWNIAMKQANQTLVVYDGTQARGASLSPATSGGNLILNAVRPKHKIR